MFQCLKRRYAAPQNAPVASWIPGNVFLPGAGSEIYVPTFQLPLFAVRGNGIMAGASPNPMQGPQIYAGNPKPVAGFGGPIAGTMWTQPLSDMENG